jgi:O-antigen ligase
LLNRLYSNKIADSKWLSLIGPIGVYLYVMSFVFPVKWDLPMIFLVLASIISTLCRTSHNHVASSHRITYILIFFLVAMAGSILVSAHWSRSFHTSVTFLPALLIYFLIIEQFTSDKEMELLYLCFSTTAFGISVAVLYYAGTHYFEFNSPRGVHTLAGAFSYIIVSRNDLTFLSIMVPFSFILAYQKPLSPRGLFAMLSIIVSFCTVIFLQSRGATLTFVITLGWVSFSLNLRKTLWISLLLLLLFVVTDALFGFPLWHRFYGLFTGTKDITNGRVSLWIAAWRNFLKAPILGNGPHTFCFFSKTPWPHNLYLEVLFGHGLVGFSAFISLLIDAGISAWNLRKKTTFEIRSFVAAALAALIGFCVSSLIELSFLRLWVTVSLFMILGIIVRLSLTFKHTMEV